MQNRITLMYYIVGKIRTTSTAFSSRATNYVFFGDAFVFMVAVSAMISNATAVATTFAIAAVFAAFIFASVVSAFIL